MESKEIIEGNKLIAIFMGGKLKHYSLSNEPYYLMPDKQKWMLERMVYHSSWDWLMPVVEKISETSNAIGNKDKDYWNNIAGSDIRIFRESMEITWQNCVQFIKWFNSQNT